MEWLRKVLTKRATCCFCHQQDSVDALECHRYWIYYSSTRRYYHESCLRQVLNHPEQHSSNKVDIALAIAERRRELEEALRAEQERRRKRLAKLELLECPYCGEPIQASRKTCAHCGAPQEMKV